MFETGEIKIQTFKMYDLDPSEWVGLAGLVFNYDLDDHVMVWGDMSYLPMARGMYNNSDWRCNHCNKRITHFVLVENIKTKETRQIGWDCYRETFSHDSRADLSYYRMQKLAKAAAERELINKNKAEFKRRLDSDDKARIALDYLNDMFIRFPGNEFYWSVNNYYEKYGTLSEGHIAALYKSWEKYQAKQTEKSKAKPAPVGKITFTGKVLSFKTQYSQWGEQLKMRLQHIDDLWVAYMSVPSNILFDVEIGDKVSLTVTLEKSDDPTFAFGKRPSKAKIV